MRIEGFDWDDGNWPKCGKHGVKREEIEQILTDDPMVLPDRTPQDKETRYNAIGTTARGRHVFIVFTIRTKSTRILLRPISARYMHVKEVNAHGR